MPGFPDKISRPTNRGGGMADVYIHDIDDPGSGSYPKYFGYSNANEDVMIMKQSDASTFRYFAARGSYATYWTARGSQTYERVFEIDYEAL